MAIQPHIQFQNPAISLYSRGWSSCAAYVGAPAIEYDSDGRLRPTGRQVREATGDTVGGLNLAQIDFASRIGWDTDMDVRYRYPWADFVRRVKGGAFAHLQGHTIVFNRTTGLYSCEPVNHSIGLPGSFGVMDPAADGRRPEIHEYNGQAYPEDLVRRFAGALILNPATGQRLGNGLVYAAFTRDRTAEFIATVRPLAGESVREYTRYQVNDDERIVTHRTRRTEGFRVRCTPPRLFRTVTGTRSVSLVKIVKPGSVYDGKYISSRWATEV